VIDFVVRNPRYALEETGRHHLARTVLAAETPTRELTARERDVLLRVTRLAVRDPDYQAALADSGRLLNTLTLELACAVIDPRGGGVALGPDGT